MLLDIIIFSSVALVAIVAGILSGMFGIGGGIFFVPTINFMLNHYFPGDANTMIIANNTSLACILLLNSFALWKRLNHINLLYWQIIVRILLLGSGAFLGGLAIRLISHEYLSLIFSASIFFIGLYYFYIPDEYTTSEKSYIKSMFPIVFLPISFLTALLGIGGAIFLFPLQLKIGFSKEKSAATSTLSTIIVSCASLLWLFIEPVPNIDSIYFYGDIFWPMLVVTALVSPLFINLGIELNKKFTKKTLHRILAILLILIAGAHHLI